MQCVLHDSVCVCARMCGASELLECVWFDQCEWVSNFISCVMLYIRKLVLFIPGDGEGQTDHEKEAGGGWARLEEGGE